MTTQVRERAGQWGRYRAPLVRMHFYAGLLVGPFLLIATVTGLLYAVIPQIDGAVYRHELTVDHVGSLRLPLSAQIAAARIAHPEGTISSISPAADPADTTRVVLSTTAVPQDYSRTVFVDPYTGKVRGALTTYGEWLPVRAWFDELHRTLHLGAFGRNYSELAASWLWVISLAGLCLWVGQRRRQGQLRRIAIPDPAAPRRARMSSWHSAVGVWILIGLLGLSVTGLTWSRYAGGHIADLRGSLGWTSPSVPAALPADSFSGPVDFGTAADRVLAAATGAGIDGPTWMTPGAAGSAWTVAERKRDWPTRYDAIAVDPGSGTIIHRLDFAQWPWIARITNWAIDAHMGVLFGIANQIALAAIAVGLIFVIVRGYQMWWRHGPLRSVLARGRPTRNAIAGLDVRDRAAIIAAAIVIGWFAPLFGLSLAAFVIADCAIGAWRRTTSKG
ncbi:PepSY-associated TM helix domain-containing protein [Nocardia sp. NPDC058058]|uniref:PepSY-associated TM helix domain-containing protein n=1 Tax=Nocardia sp. NPDC058058 TaxID=3346317 RepID=UPI0036D91027